MGSGVKIDPNDPNLSQPRGSKKVSKKVSMNQKERERIAARAMHGTLLNDEMLYAFENRNSKTFSRYSPD